jgi:hypothetical protein
METWQLILSILNCGVILQLYHRTLLGELCSENYEFYHQVFIQFSQNTILRRGDGRRTACLISKETK